ncbi:hypothetical protein PInf_019124 [Phytophthora infestans]|nr:hypothetical protein PInf_019124 [Phytophthora infestans]
MASAILSPILDEYNLEDDESAFEEQGNDFGDYESDIESDPQFKDESVLFEQDDDEMRVLGNSRWDIYDEAHGRRMKIAEETEAYRLSASLGLLIINENGS